MLSLVCFLAASTVSLQLPTVAHGVKACSACKSGSDRTGAALQDDFSLLQAEVKKSSKPAAARKAATSATADKEGPEMSTCSIDDVGACGNDSSQTPAGLALAALSSTIRALPEERKGEEAPALLADVAAAPESTPSKEGASTAVLVMRFALLASTIMILADGVKRTLQSPRGCKAAACAARSKQPSAAAVAEATHANLMQAALDGDVARCEALIQQGVDAHGSDIWGSTPLHAAARSGSAALLSRLLQLGLDTELEAKDVWAETPLHVGARAGHLEACEVLLAFGADIEAVNQQGCTPLVVAGHEGQDSVCDMLRGHGAVGGELPEEAEEDRQQEPDDWALEFASKELRGDFDIAPDSCQLSAGMFLHGLREACSESMD